MAFTLPSAKALGSNEETRDTLLASDGVLTGDVGVPILGRQAKVDALEGSRALGLDRGRW